MNKKINIILIVIVGVITLLSILPGEGMKAADLNQFGKKTSDVGTEYSCSTVEDCPSCVMDLSDFSNETKPMSSCSNGMCTLSDACVIWDCNEANNCHSIRQTLLDNTVQKFNEHPGLLIFLILIGVVYGILAIK
jgi:hypothetical protein